MALMTSREMTNGLANRFLMLWAERSEILPFPRTTPQNTVEALANRVIDILEFVRPNLDNDGLPVTLSPQAQSYYGQLYRGELNDDDAGARVTTLMERRAPMLLRIAMLFALTDLRLCVDVVHIEAAMAWIRYTNESAKYVFISASDEVKMLQVGELAHRIVAFLELKVQASRSEITVECFQGHESKAHIDAAIERLLNSSPPRISIQVIYRPKEKPGSPTTIYKLIETRAQTGRKVV
jgi:hypothetical protein